jgi:hypothetical protein
MSLSDKYWFQDFNVLLNTDVFYLKSGMSYVEKVNTIVRLSIFIGVVASIVMRNYLYLYIPILTMLLTYVLYLFRQIDKSQKMDTSNSQLKEKLSQNVDTNSTLNAVFDAQNELEHFNNSKSIKDATYPSQSNPFMNPLPFDSRDRPEAINQSSVSSRINKYFNRNLFKEIGDIFNKENSQREFYTVASTTYPSHQEDFANWLYKTPPTCKEGNGNQCVANNSDRLMASFKLPYHTTEYNKQVMGY